MKADPVFAKRFTRSAAVLLLLTACAKLLSSFAAKPSVLGVPDPLLGLSSGGTLLLVAMVELAVMAVLLSRAPISLKGLLAAWLGGNFLLYRLALATLQPGRPCKCLGTLTDYLPLDDRAAGLLLTLVSLYLTAGGLWVYSRGWRRSATAIPMDRRRLRQTDIPL